MIVRAVPPLVLAGAALALAPAPASAQDDAHGREVEGRHPRAVVADGRDGRVSVVDLRSGRRLRTFDLGAAASVVPAGDGRHVAAVQGEAGRVRVVDAGTWAEEHGDHVHRHVAAPRLSPFVVRVPSPSHVVGHGGRVAVFADGEGTAHVWPLEALARRAGASQRVATGQAHHGVAVPLGARLLVTTPAPGAEDGALPGGVALVGAVGAEQARFGDCPELHGEAAGEGWAAFACADGVLLVEGTGAVTATKVPYPRGSGGEDRRVWSLRADARGRRVVGTLGASRVLVVDRAARTTRLVSAGRRIAGLDADRATGRAYALTTDGRVHAIDPRAGRVVRSARVTRAFRTGGDAPRPTPSVAAGAGRVVVSDPARARVHVLRASTLARTSAVRVPGAPQRLALAGTE